MLQCVALSFHCVCSEIRCPSPRSSFCPTHSFSKAFQSCRQIPAVILPSTNIQLNTAFLLASGSGPVMLLSSDMKLKYSFTENHNTHRYICYALVVDTVLSFTLRSLFSDSYRLKVYSESFSRHSDAWGPHPCRIRCSKYRHWGLEPRTFGPLQRDC